VQLTRFMLRRNTQLCSELRLVWYFASYPIR